MLRSQLSILGIYHHNNDVFEGLTVPEGMNRDTVITEILAQCSELELVYPSYPVMKEMITCWSRAELPQWVRVLEDMTIKYNPIWNVDGTETETITRELEGTTSGERAGNNRNTLTGNSSVSNTENTTTTNSSKAYNDTGWTETDKTVGNATGTSTGTNSETTTGQNSETSSGSNIESETITTTKTRGGNIGVTMTQQMLTADLDLLLRLNPYQWIVDSFRRRFCLLVY